MVSCLSDSGGFRYFVVCCGINYIIMRQKNIFLIYIIKVLVETTLEKNKQKSLTTCPVTGQMVLRCLRMSYSLICLTLPITSTNPLTPFLELMCPVTGHTELLLRCLRMSNSYSAVS